MSLLLEVEYLAGLCVAARGPDSDVPDWPPQPDRVFSALVASWGARGALADEAAALVWLESQPAPLIGASDVALRTPVTRFVPPNDAETGRSGNREVMPAHRRRQPRRFPAVRPHDPTVRFFWSDSAPDEATFAALDRLAFNTAYLGHSSSLTRCRFVRDAMRPAASWREPELAPYTGRLAELRRGYEDFVASGGRQGRPLSGALVRSRPKVDEPPPHAFESRWLLLEHIEHSQSVMPDIRGAGVVAKVLRDTLLAGYARVGASDCIPEVVSGHAPDGSPSRLAHIAVVPLAFIGARYADGHVMGFALVPPRGSRILEDDDFLRALRAIAPLDEKRGRRILTVKPKAGSSYSFQIDLSPTFEAPVGRRSLNPQTYTSVSTVFATVTPLVLDRHLKTKGNEQEAEITAQVAQACVNAGLPKPDAVVTHKHSAFEGAPSARPSGHAPSWTQWQLPSSLRSRPLVHAVIRFSTPVKGPVILGAGRFVGLGLCLPLEWAGE